MDKPNYPRNPNKPLLNKPPAITPEELIGLGFNTAEARTISNLTKREVKVRVSQSDNAKGNGRDCRGCSLAIALNRTLPIMRAVVGPRTIALESKYNLEPALTLTITAPAQAVINAADAGKPDPFTVIINWEKREAGIGQ